MRKFLFIVILFILGMFFYSCKGKTIRYEVVKKVKEGVAPRYARYIIVMENENGKVAHKVSYVDYYRYEVGDSIDWWYILQKRSKRTH